MLGCQDNPPLLYWSWGETQSKTVPTYSLQGTLVQVAEVAGVVRIALRHPDGIVLVREGHVSQLVRETAGRGLLTFAGPLQKLLPPVQIDRTTVGGKPCSPPVFVGVLAGVQLAAMSTYLALVCCPKVLAPSSLP